MELIQELDINIQLNLGVQEEPYQESQEFLVLVLIDLVKPLSVTCVDQEECSLPYIYGEDGIEELI